MSIFDKSWNGDVKGSAGEEKQGEKEAPVKPAGEPHSVGDRIAGRYEIHKILGGEGKSGMGIVYICYDHEGKGVLALKTFQDRFLSSKGMKDNFKKEALLWTHLERHPYIVRAEWVQELDYRMFVICEFIAPDDEGRNTLAHYLKSPISLKQALTWSIQFCYGMGHASDKGVTPHRDIKPDNIMITRDGVVKIADFGLAGLWQKAGMADELKRYQDEGGKGFTFIKMAGDRIAAGTPPWMAPEQFDGEADTRSDIYSFGIVLYQMLSGGRLPYHPKASDTWEIAHKTYPVLSLQDTPSLSLRGAVVAKAISGLFSMIERSLKKRPEERYCEFKELRHDLERLYRDVVGEPPPSLPDKIGFEAWEHNNKGVSFWSLGLYDEAINECKQAVRLKPHDGQFHHSFGIALYAKGLIDNAIQEFKEALKLEPGHAKIHNGLGAALKDKGFLDEAIQEFKEALKLKPEDVFARNSLAVTLKKKGFLDEAILELRDTLKLKPDYADAHYNLGNTLLEKGQFNEAILEYKQALRLNPHSVKFLVGLGNAFDSLGRFDEAIQYFDKAIDLAPQDFICWNNKGDSLNSLGRFSDAIGCLDRAIELNPQNATAWANKGLSLENLNQVNEALKCYDKAIELGDEQADNIWNIKGTIFNDLQRFDDAIYCFDKAIGINPKYLPAWTNKGNTFDAQGLIDEAIRCYDKAIELNPHSYSAWYDKGVCLMNIGNNDEAVSCFKESIRCFDENIEHNPRYAAAWLNKALCEEKIKRFHDAVASYNNFIEVAPSQYERHITYAREREAELSRK